MIRRFNVVAVIEGKAYRTREPVWSVTVERDGFEASSFPFFSVESAVKNAKARWRKDRKVRRERVKALALRRRGRV